MKKLLLLALSIGLIPSVSKADEKVELAGKEYTVTTLQDRDLGSGVRYTRLRIADYPLNINMLRIDVTNPYNSVEVQQASEKLYSTELLTSGAKRNSAPGHVALAGANANFWCVSGQPPYSDYLIGVTYNGNLKNGKIITETNCKNDKYNGGLKHTGVTGISTDGKVYSSNQFKWEGWITSEATGDLEIYQCNKVVRDGELGLYNSFYPSSRQFYCVDQEETHFVIAPNSATEVYLTMDAGEEWSAGDDMTFTVKSVRTNAGNGTIGSHDLALVGRGDNAAALARLSAGDKVSVRYNWIAPDGTKVKMANLVGGNAQVMVDGELTSYNDSEKYNSQVYSRTGYGCNADGTVLYVIVIDKAPDPIYGASAGCPTSVMCQIAKHYGCTSMTNFDAGGSAMMMVGDRIVNKTTEGSPRAVANGMIAYSIAPVDDEVTRLEFYDYVLKSPVYATSQPRIVAYNKYGAMITDDFTGATLTCSPDAGTCDGNTFTAGAIGTDATLTATYNGVSVTKPIQIVESGLKLGHENILIDCHRSVRMVVTTEIDGQNFVYDASQVKWTVGNGEIASVDSRGVLTGLRNGTTTITGTIGDFTDSATVTVEESFARELPLEDTATNPDDWKLSYTSTKNGVLKANGNQGGFSLDFEVSSTRTPRIQVAKDIRLYGLPDELHVTVQPGLTNIKSVVVSLTPGNDPHAIPYTYEATFATEQDHVVALPLGNFADTDDITSYPFTFSSLAFNLSGGSGKYHIDVPRLTAVYRNWTGVEDIKADAPASDAAPRYFNLQGIEVNGANLAPGVYVRTENGTAVKIMIK